MKILIKKLEDLFGIDIRALAIMRILFSFLILIDLLDRFGHLTAFYTDQGVLPRAYAIKLLNPYVICPHLIGGSWGFQAFLFFLQGIFVLGLLVGYRTRLCTLVTWIMLASLHNRNVLNIGAEDKLLHILFFWFLFLPWGACYSLDSCIQKKTTPLRVSSIATFGYLLQICFFYAFSGFLKTHPQWTIEGTATYYAYNCSEFIKPLGQHLLQFPQILKGITFFTLYLERWGVFFFFLPFFTNQFRLLTIFLFVCLHIGILLSMELFLFQWVCLVTLIAFLPTSFFDKILRNINLSSKASFNINQSKSLWKPNLFNMPSYLSIILACFLLYIFFWNMGELEKPRFHIPKNIKWIGYAFNINQHWGMFAPRPMTDNGWCILPGKLRNGKMVDVFQNKGTPITWEEPVSIVKHNNSYIWTLYYLNIRHKNNFKYRLPYMKYICNQWNGVHFENEQLAAFDFIFMDKETLPDYQKPAIERIVLSSYSCSEHKIIPSIFKKGGISTR